MTSERDGRHPPGAPDSHLAGERRHHQAFRELSKNLEARVREAVEELDQKNRALVLQSRQAIMGEMLGNIAHQWRQPLNTLVLLAQELRMTQTFDINMHGSLTVRNTERGAEFRIEV